MRMRWPWLWAAFSLCILPDATASEFTCDLTPAVIHDANLMQVGATVPPFGVDSRVQGEPVVGFDLKSLYILEGWATWCAPCRQAIPHLDELHRRFASRGLVVIGVAVEEKNRLPVESFVKRQGGRMSYRVAYDQNGAFVRDWLSKTEGAGIPRVIVVKSGRLLWVVLPGRLSNEKVEAMLTGAFTEETARREKSDMAEYEAAGTRFAAFLKAGRISEAEVESVRLDGLTLRLWPDRAKARSIVRRVRLAQSRRDAGALLAQLRLLSACDAPSESAESQWIVAEVMATHPVLTNCRDYGLALAAVERYRIAAPESAEDRAYLLLHARILAAVGRNTEAATLLRVAAGDKPLKLDAVAGADDTLRLKKESITALAALENNRPWTESSGGPGGP